MAEYTIMTGVAVAATVALDLALLRTRVLAQRAFWISLAIMWGFQVLVDGWLTKLSSPIVLYNEDRFSGRRVFFDSPVEDFGFGFAMILLTLSVWNATGGRQRPARRHRAVEIAERHHEPDANRETEMRPR
jgi:lycopene cyclase domain-containing protein